MKRIFSLASVNVTITTGRGDQISIGGGGKLLGSVSYTYDNSLYSVSSTADGGAAVGLNRSMAGTISFDFKQTAPIINILTEYFIYCRNNPEKAEASMECRDSFGNINFTATGVFPSKLPGNTMGETVGNRTFEFSACEIEPKIMDGAEV